MLITADETVRLLLLAISSRLSPNVFEMDGLPVQQHICTFSAAVLQIRDKLNGTRLQNRIFPTSAAHKRDKQWTFANMIIKTLIFPAVAQGQTWRR